MRRKNAANAERDGEQKLARTAEKALVYLGVSGARVAVFFLPSREMSFLKWKFLGKRRKFVDVLAFPEPPGFPHPGERTRVLGEIYINRAFMSAGDARLFHLLFHGILHILGYSHEKKSDTIEMEKLEDELLGKFVRS